MSVPAAEAATLTAAAVPGQAALLPPYRPQRVQALPRAPPAQLQAGTQGQTGEDETAVLDRENRLLAADLNVVRASEALLKKKVGFLQSKLTLWERTGKRVAEREVSIMNYLAQRSAAGAKGAPPPVG